MSTLIPDGALYFQNNIPRYNGFWQNCMNSLNKFKHIVINKNSKDGYNNVIKWSTTYHQIFSNFEKSFHLSDLHLLQMSTEIGVPYAIDPRITDVSEVNCAICDELDKINEKKNPRLKFNVSKIIFNDLIAIIRDYFVAHFTNQLRIRNEILLCGSLFASYIIKVIVTICMEHGTSW
ncbi:hypothetical protein C6P45_004462 [Maudiozyma exigua]|uniref:Uncharacterized protein n=1 Tax=Maudiozyma exigua TaxID=34358 RepID=A0A9P6WEC5_MAUEX|nr:hypothetical protein C6P45_004462 [Kazachstania exigua]